MKRYEILGIMLVLFLLMFMFSAMIAKQYSNEVILKQLSGMQADIQLEISEQIVQPLHILTNNCK